MSIHFPCTNCEQSLFVERESDGLVVRCANCQALNTIRIVDAPSQAGIQSQSSPHGSPLSDQSRQASDSSSPLARQEATERRLYLVRLPNGQTYGPADQATIEQWAMQGRVNFTCDISRFGEDLWVGYDTWKGRSMSQRFESPTKQEPTNIFGNDLGRLEKPVNFPQYRPTGVGLKVLVISIVSWILCPTVFGSIILSCVAIAIAYSRRPEESTDSNESIMLVLGLILAFSNLAISLLGLLMFSNGFFIF